MYKITQKITWYNAILFIPGMMIGVCVLVVFKCGEVLVDGIYYILER